MDINWIRIGDALPVNLYVNIDSRHILFRAEGDQISRQVFDRLELKEVKQLFVLDSDLPKFKAWSQPPADSKPAPVFQRAREDAGRKLFDIFHSDHPEAFVTEAVASSKKLVAEVMMAPYAVQALGQLQTFSRGTVDHSVNVSILSVYLAIQMGYTHNIILQHIGAGALLHDIGKRKVPINDDDSPEAYDAKMKEHPTYGLRILENMDSVPNEVKMIVSQHHEFYDGTGYPKKMRGKNIYDLARLVGIADKLDELVIEGKGTLVQRQKAALMQLDQLYTHKFEIDKLDKVIKILKFGV